MGVPVSETRWRARPWAAGALRAMICAVPVAAAAAVGLLLAAALPTPVSLLGWLLWLAIVLGAGGAVGVAVERGVRRLAPLAWLVRLSIVFPDQAPSRFGLALRVSSTKRLRAWLIAERDSGRERNAAEHAEVVLGLAAALGVHDRMTRGHCERVRALTDLVADELHLDLGTKDRLRWAALLHDIGKLQVPTQLLNKTTALTPHERAMVARHPIDGAQLASPLLEWLGQPGRAIAEHHERYDGTGYPKGLAGHEISLGGRIVAVTDAFDTMTSVRSYKRAMSVRAARAEIARCAGTHFDPVIARTFLDMSLPRLSLIVGPLAVLAQLPVVGVTLRSALRVWEIPALAAGGAKAIGSAMVLATGIVTGSLTSGPIRRGGADGEPASAPNPPVVAVAGDAATVGMPGGDPGPGAVGVAPAAPAGEAPAPPPTGAAPPATTPGVVALPPSGQPPEQSPSEVVPGLVDLTPLTRERDLPLGILQLPH